MVALAFARLLALIALLTAGCAQAASPPPAAPAERVKIPRVGLVSFPGDVWKSWTQAFRDGLAELGYVEGQNILVDEVHPVDNDLNAMLATIRTFHQDQVDVIISTFTIPLIPDLARAAAPIPIIEPLLNTPNVGPDQPVASYARPGGNMTGIIAIDVAHHAKRLQLLKEVAPKTTRVIVLTPWDRPADLPGWPEITEMARTLNIEVDRVQPSGPEDIDPAIAAAVQRGANGLLQYQGNPWVNREVMQRVVDVAAKYRLPAMYIVSNWTHLGGLMSYSPNPHANWKRAAVYVDKIFKGAWVGDLPVEQPAKFAFVVNLKSAQALGLTVPQTVLAQASEIIQ